MTNGKNPQHLSCAIAVLLFGSFRLLAQPLPWPEGEKLTYLIEWGLIPAAEGTFTATTEPGQEGVQRFDLYLRSRGPIEAFCWLFFFFYRSRIESTVPNQEIKSTVVSISANFSSLLFFL